MATRSTLIDETAAYDQWRATVMAVGGDALARKRERMADSPFALLRITCSLAGPLARPRRDG